MTTPPPTTGTHQLQVRYVECDPMGVVHHSSYLPWMEMGRTELLREIGKSYAALEAEGVFLVVTKVEVKYRRPLKYDDVVEIRTKVDKTSKVKLHHSYEIVLVERLGKAPDASDPSVPSDGVCAVATTELACVGTEGRPKALPEWLALP
ncbi:MAG: acyl-CoA thioesterase [Phycisphaerales bacterium]|nr:acyl-CoA thioesterase [Phycisphaerales bacterium]